MSETITKVGRVVVGRTFIYKSRKYRIIEIPDMMNVKGLALQPEPGTSACVVVPISKVRKLM